MKKSIYDLEKQQQKNERIFPLSGIYVCVGGKTLKFFLVDCAPKKRGGNFSFLLARKTESKKKHNTKTPVLLNEAKIFMWKVSLRVQKKDEENRGKFLCAEWESAVQVKGSEFTELLKPIKINESWWSFKE